MLSVNAIYEDGKVTLLEEIPRVKRARAILTLLDDEQPVERDMGSSLFDDLVGVVSVRDDGSVAHDDYLSDRLFRQYSDKDFSVTDCTSFAVMTANGIRHFAGFDSHFEQMSFLSAIARK